MRTALGWADLAGRRVGIFGLGIEGHAALSRLGEIDCELVLVDDAPVAVSGREVLLTANGGQAALLGCDVVIKSPGISRKREEIRALEAAGIPVVGGLGLSLHELDRSKVICVTGTKGKSTTSSILGHLARGLGLRAEVRGNIGSPPFEAGLTNNLDLLVIETSSFQATDVTDAPAIVVVTSLGEDHVDWHGNPATYIADKLGLTSLPGATMTIAQGRSSKLRSHADQLGGEILWSDALADTWSEPLGLLGDHNLANAELARLALVMFGVPGANDPDLLRRAALNYEPLSGRLTLIANIDGVRFIDDSLATNPLPTMAALGSFADVPVALLLGGYDRGVDYAELLDVLRARSSPTFVIGLPDSGHRLVRELTGSEDLELTTATSVAEAVHLARVWTPANGIVLLSPAASSFSQFANWKERSEAFRTAIHEARS